MSRMTVYPAEGRVVPDPEAGGNLPAQGRDVPRDAYWLRRLQDQDVTLDAPKKGKATPKPQAAAAPGSAEE
jgi:hypothetical protein